MLREPLAGLTAVALLAAGVADIGIHVLFTEVLLSGTEDVSFVAGVRIGR